MVEYIEREKVLAKKTEIHRIVHCQGADEEDVYNAVLIEDINAIPAADVRCVVTCSECKHWNRNEEGNLCCTKDADEDESFPGLYFGFISYHRPDFFCADGERRENT